MIKTIISVFFWVVFIIMILLLHTQGEVIKELKEELNECNATRDLCLDFYGECKYMVNNLVGLEYYNPFSIEGNVSDINLK